MDDIIELTSICEKYFGLKPRIARHKAALGTLPVPAFRLAAAQRGPLFVRKEDLDALVETRASAARRIHVQVSRLQRVMPKATDSETAPASSGRRES